MNEANAKENEDLRTRYKQLEAAHLASVTDYEKLSSEHLVLSKKIATTPGIDALVEENKSLSVRIANLKESASKLEDEKESLVREVKALKEACHQAGLLLKSSREKETRTAYQVEILARMSSSLIQAVTDA